MLQYLGSGTRDYLAKPVWPYTRGCWEFQAFINGAGRLLLDSGRAEPERSRVLYVFSPECVHGWTGNGQPSEVAVFHFDQVPAEVSGLITGIGWLALPLDEAGAERLRRLLVEATRESELPRVASSLHFQRILIELSLEVLRLAQPETASREKAKVDAVIAWYMARLSEAPTLVQAARMQAVSVAQLRRLFHAVLGRGPQEVMTQMRFQRAAGLIRETELPLSVIAEAVGFSEASAFSRGFRRHFGVEPSSWRR
jgi:AraC-like DNA-binding protein